MLFILTLIFFFCGGPKKTETAAPADTTQTAVTSESTPSAPAPPAAQTASEKPATPPPPASSEAPEKPAALPKLWDFFATWCPPCKKQAPIIEELAKEYAGRIEIISIDTDKNPDLARKFNIQAIPTLVFLDAEGKELSRNVGLMSKEEILARFREHKFIE
uniref:Thioredoxin n=1 Tax=candidate division WOR-3 bacterium TaxID=2052148 RepID=A0A7C2B4V7_UNCW3